MNDRLLRPPGESSKAKLVLALLLGLLGSLTTWFGTSYNYLVIGVSYLADSTLPCGAIIFVLLTVLVLNPFLRRYKPGWVLTARYLALAYSIMLIATVIPTQGLLLTLPSLLGFTPVYVRDNAPLAEVFQTMNLPSYFFPDKISFGGKTPIADAFVTELSPGQVMPWGAWLGPLLTWGPLVIFCWMMMIGIALIVLPQWRNNERLPFPILTVTESLLEDPPPGRIIPALFRNRGFWFSAAVVFLLHFLSGMHTYSPDTIPEIPLRWNLGRLFAVEPWIYLPASMYNNRIYFAFVAIAFFMPTRISFSVWFFMVAYAFWAVMGKIYFTPLQAGMVSDHRFGGMFALTVGVMWLGRAHWARVFGSLFRRPRDEEDASNKKAAWWFTLGCLGFLCWFMWVGVKPVWALAFLAFGFMVCISITRIAAETGMPFVRIDTLGQLPMVRILPFHFIDPISLYFSYIAVTLFPTATRMSACNLATHALGLDRTASPKKQTSLAGLLLLVLIAGMLLGGAVHLNLIYHHSATVDGRPQITTNWAIGNLNLGNIALQEWRTGRLTAPSYNQLGHIGFGVFLGGALQWASLMLPRWPLHPIGLLMVQTFYSNEAWASIFIGWLIKVLLLRYGGARLYRAAVPTFLGLIIGDTLASVFWGVVPVFLIALDMPYKVVQIQPF